MIRVPRRLIRPNPVPSDVFNLGQTRNRLHVARSRANILGLGGNETDVPWSNHFAEKEAVPQMINRTKNALKVNPFLMHVYFKFRGGRRCSCWGKGETPDGYCVSCFPPGTLVRTIRGYVPIEIIKIGDMVLSSDGKFHAVTEAMSREYRGDLISVTSTVSTNPILSTPEHPYKAMTGTHQLTLKEGCGPGCDLRLVNSKNVGSIKRLPSGRWNVRIQISASKNSGRVVVGTFDTKKEAREALNLYKKHHLPPRHKLGWVYAEELSEKSWLVAKYPSHQACPESIQVPSKYLKNTNKGPQRKGQDYFIVDDDFLWVVGMYIAEGSSGSRRIKFTLNVDEVEYQNRISAYFEDKGYTTEVRPKKGTNGVDVIVYSTTLASWFPKWLGKWCWKKHIPEELSSLPNDKAKALLQGVFDGDGSKTESDPRVVQTSEILALQVSEILHRLGEQPLIHQYRQEGKRLAYGVSWKWEDSVRRKNNRKGRWAYGTETLAKVRETGLVHYHGKVYNLEVEDTHDYVVNGVVVHNCFKAGYVGGYEKFGCQTELIDSTHPDLSLVNVLPDVKSGRVPIPLTLTSKATFGIVEVRVNLASNNGILDLFKVHSSTPKGSSVRVLIRRSTESKWVPANEDNITNRLGSGVVFFRIELSRDQTSISAPYLKAIRLRYQVRGTERADTLVPMNIPLGEESFQLQDLGLWETFTTLQLFTDNTLKAIKNEDFIHNPRDNRRFMIINAKKFDPTNTTVSWLLNARFVQSELDAINEFPIGGDTELFSCKDRK